MKTEGDAESYLFAKRIQAFDDQGRLVFDRNYTFAEMEEDDFLVVIR